MTSGYLHEYFPVVYALTNSLFTRAVYFKPHVKLKDGVKTGKE